MTRIYAKNCLGTPVRVSKTFWQRHGLRLGGIKVRRTYCQWGQPLKEHLIQDTVWTIPQEIFITQEDQMIDRMYLKHQTDRKTCVKQELYMEEETEPKKGQNYPSTTLISNHHT